MLRYLCFHYRSFYLQIFGFEYHDDISLMDSNIPFPRTFSQSKIFAFASKSELVPLVSLAISTDGVTLPPNTSSYLVPFSKLQGCTCAQTTHSKRARPMTRCTTPSLPHCRWALPRVLRMWQITHYLWLWMSCRGVRQTEVEFGRRSDITMSQINVGVVWMTIKTISISVGMLQCLFFSFIARKDLSVAFVICRTRYVMLHKRDRKSVV